MGQPGSGAISGRGWFMPESTTYYYDCKSCGESKSMVLGRVGKYPRHRYIKADNCKHRYSDNSFEANGSVCTGYEPGWNIKNNPK